VTNVEEPGIAWRKSTASNTGGCVEVAVGGGSVLIRDSRSPEEVVLRFPSVSWSAFLARIWAQDSRLGLRRYGSVVRRVGRGRYRSICEDHVILGTCVISLY
jgi:Domain of unknown function (DUF397)